MSKIFDELLLKGIRSGQIPARTQDARDWFRDKAKQSKRMTPGQFKSSSDPERFMKEHVIGNMYMFQYSPKHKKTLPYYDIFPLIFPVGPAKGGFYGINFHYLPHKERAILMDALYSARNNSKYDETTKLKLSYSILQGSSKYKNFKPCFKHYLDDHIAGKFIYINPSEWDIALFLSTHSFRKMPAKKVWVDSRDIIAGRKPRHASKARK